MPLVDILSIINGIASITQQGTDDYITDATTTDSKVLRKVNSVNTDQRSWESKFAEGSVVFAGTPKTYNITATITASYTVNKYSQIPANIIHNSIINISGFFPLLDTIINSSARTTVNGILRYFGTDNGNLLATTNINIYQTDKIYKKFIFSRIIQTTNNTIFDVDITIYKIHSYNYISYYNILNDISSNILQQSYALNNFNATILNISINNIDIRTSNDTTYYLFNRNISNIIVSVNNNQLYNPAIQQIIVKQWNGEIGILNNYFNNNIISSGYTGYGNPTSGDESGNNYPLSLGSIYYNILIDTSACYIDSTQQLEKIIIYKNKEYNFTPYSILSQYFANSTFFTNPSGATVPEIIRRTTDLTNSDEYFMGIYITQLPDIQYGILQYSRDSGANWLLVPQYITLPYDAQLRFIPNSNVVTRRGQPVQFKFRAWEPFPLSPTTGKSAYIIIDPPVDPGRSLSELDFSQQEGTIQIEIKDSPSIVTRTPTVVFHKPTINGTKNIELNWMLNTLPATTPNYSLYVDGNLQSISPIVTSNYISTIYGNSYAFYATTVSGMDTYYSNTQIVNIPAIVRAATPIISTANLIDVSFNIQTTNLSGDLSYAILTISGSNNYPLFSRTINKSQIAPVLNNVITVSGTLDYNSVFNPSFTSYYTDNTNYTQWLNPIVVSCPSGTTGAINLSGIITQYKSITFLWNISGIKTPLSNYISNYSIDLSGYNIITANSSDISATIQTRYPQDISYNASIIINYTNGTVGPKQIFSTYTTIAGRNQPIDITGFNADIITDTTDGSGNKTTTGILGDATGNSNYILHMVNTSGGIPSNGRISYNAAGISGDWTLSGLTTGNNALMLSGNNVSGTLIFNTSGMYSAVSILGLASAASNISGTVNYSDSTTNSFSTTIPIYSASSLSNFNPFINMYNISGGGSTPIVRRATRQNTISVGTAAADIIRLYAYIMPTDTAKTINSITVQNRTNSRVFILAVSGYT